MTIATRVRRRIKAGRARGERWVRLIEIVRLLPSGEGRARLWTQIVHGGEVHQTSPDTSEDRYPELFDLAARLKPDAMRILSFGCSTGEELVSLRRRFPDAEIVGAEINPRSRSIAAGKTAGDPHIHVVRPTGIAGMFDLVFTLAVLQREPFRIAEMQVQDLTPFYPFERFDRAVVGLVERLNRGGLLCVAHAHYRIEDSSAVRELESVSEAPRTDCLLFGRDGHRLDGASGGTLFRKRG